MTTPTTRLAGPLVWLPGPDSTPMASRALEWAAFLRLVDTVGIAPPPRYGELLASYGRIQAAAISGHTMQTRLTSAVLHGGRDDDYEMLLAAALSERYAAASQLQAGLLSEVRDQVLDALRRVYAEVAAANYAKLRTRFDSTADKFTACACVVDPDCRPGVVINAKPKIVQAWRDAETHAGELDQLLEPLSAAAELVRPLHKPSGLGSDRAPFLLPLVANTDGLHRRQTWHAWLDITPPRPVSPGLTSEAMEAPAPSVQNTRCGRWARLIRLGAELRANADPENMELFDLLAPIGVKLEQVAPNKAAYVRHDPEDDRAPKQRRSPGSVLLDRLAPFRRRNTDGETVDILDTVPDTNGADAPPAREGLHAEGWGG